MSNQFNERLNSLFETADFHVTNAMVVRGMTEFGCRISTPYLSQLRTGVRTNPSPEVVAALAHFFNVHPDYFYAPVRSHSARDLRWRGRPLPPRTAAQRAPAEPHLPCRRPLTVFTGSACRNGGESTFLRKSSARTTGLEFLHVTRIAPFADSP